MFTLLRRAWIHVSPIGSPRRNWSVNRRMLLAGAILAGLLGALLLPRPDRVRAALPTGSGAIWLPTQQATFSKLNIESLSMATYRNHAYILWIQGDLFSHPVYWVYYTTNASGAWKTRLLTKAGPGYGGVGDQGRVLIAVDPTLKRLYAAWPASTGPGGHSQLVLYTSSDEGATWQGPTTLAKSSVTDIFPNIAFAVGGGKVAVAFDDNPHDFGVKPACPGSIADVLAVTYTGTAWTALQDVSSCVAAQPHGFPMGFRAQRLAYDETSGRFSLVALDDTDARRLWYAQGSGTTWSTPALTPMTHLVNGYGDVGGGLYQVAAAGGVTDVAYALSTKPGAGTSNVDVYLATHRAGQGWAVQRVTQDPLDCQKFDVAVAARPGRLALAYRFANNAMCARTGGPPEEYIHVLTGLPGHFKESVPLEPPLPSSCWSPVLSTDGDLFRVVQECSNVGPNTSGSGDNLYYTPEFLDVVGPTTHISGISSAGPGAIRVAWSAQDPTPGSGVAYAQVQVRVDGGAWQNVVTATQSHFIVYTHAQAGHTYTFRVRSRDKVNNWGAWVTATLKAT